MSPDAVDVAAAAIVVDGRVLAARRTHPADVAGGWELPGGKIDPGESVADAVAREVYEELGCRVEFVRSLAGCAAIKPGYELTAHLVRLASGEPIPHEHDAMRWLSAEELYDVDWLPSDRPFLDELHAVLSGGGALAGGNVGGAVRVGQTVRRATGGWTPAVHAVLAHLAEAGLGEVPTVLGTDEAGREVLTYLPGRVLWDNSPGAPVSDALVAEAGRWLSRFHTAVADFTHPGPWRTTDEPLRGGQIVCHHDFAPYNVALSSSATGERIVGVFDWDMAAPGVPLDDLAFAAWNWVPLHAFLPAAVVARRITILSQAYDGPFTPSDVLRAVVPRIERSIAVMRRGQAMGDPGMLNLLALGQPARVAEVLGRLRPTIDSVEAVLRAG